MPSGWLCEAQPRSYLRSSDSTSGSTSDWFSGVLRSCLSGWLHVHQPQRQSMANLQHSLAQCRSLVALF